MQTTQNTTTQTTSTQSIASIDMFTPARTCELLDLDEAGVIELVNQGHLPAYNIGGEIRFKVVDVLAATTVIAA